MDWFISYLGFVFGTTALVFCVGGPKSAKNQLAELRDRIEQLEAAAGNDNTDSES